MNHMVLPTGNDVDTGSAYHGVNAMELLINEIIKLGGDRRRLEGKLFGGARMVAGLSDVGARNTEFALDFFEREGILCQSKSLGGESARKVQFVPTSGKARQMLVAATEVKEPVQKPKPKPTEDVELF
ncbi:MAG: chemotaxis protein CheD [Pseudomonadota bacterium]